MENKESVIERMEKSNNESHYNRLTMDDWMKSIKHISDSPPPVNYMPAEILLSLDNDSFLKEYNSDNSSIVWRCSSRTADDITARYMKLTNKTINYGE